MNAAVMEGLGEDIVENETVSDRGLEGVYELRFGGHGIFVLQLQDSPV